MSNNGKLAVGAIFFLGLAATAVSLLYQYQTTRRILRFWGTETVAVVARAPVVEAFRLDSAGQKPAVVEQTDISRARGLVHLRQALLEDRNFAWDEPSGRGDPVWSYGLRFRDGVSSATLWFSADFRRARRADSSASVSTAPIAAGLATVFAEYLAEKRKERVDGQ